MTVWSFTFIPIATSGLTIATIERQFNILHTRQWRRNRFIVEGAD